MERQMQNITLPVDAEAAMAYRGATNEEKTKLQLLVSAMLKQRLDAVNTPSLLQIMDNMSDYAESRGLTEEKLRDILADNA
jgi:endonuclease III